MGDWCGEAEAPRLPGGRIAMRADERGLRADPELAGLVVQLPEPYVNADWAQPGGSAAHAMYHLSLSAKPSRVWSVDVGEGTGSGAHLLAQPIVVGDTVYTMDSRSLVSAFAATDGTRRWQVDVEDEDEDAGFFGGGIASDGQTLFVSPGFARIFAPDAATAQTP